MLLLEAVRWLLHSLLHSLLQQWWMQFLLCVADLHGAFAGAPTAGAAPTATAGQQLRKVGFQVGQAFCLPETELPLAGVGHQVRQALLPVIGVPRPRFVSHS
jgi:hypothetical protein